MKLYHVTRKDTYDKYVSTEGLKPICDIAKKSYPDCEEGIYFHDNIPDANYEGRVYTESPNPQPWIMIEVSLDDILNECKCLSKDYRHLKGSYYATSHVYDRRKKEKAKFYSDYPCIIKPEKLKVIQSSLK